MSTGNPVPQRTKVFAVYLRTNVLFVVSVSFCAVGVLLHCVGFFTHGWEIYLRAYDGATYYKGLWGWTICDDSTGCSSFSILSLSCEILFHFIKDVSTGE